MENNNPIEVEKPDNQENENIKFLCRKLFEKEKNIGH